MVKKSVKHFLNLIFTLILSLCFALFFSVSSYADFVFSDIHVSDGFSRSIAPATRFTTTVNVPVGVAYDSSIYKTTCSVSLNSRVTTGNTAIRFYLYISYYYTYFDNGNFVDVFLGTYDTGSRNSLDYTQNFDISCNGALVNFYAVVEMYSGGGNSSSTNFTYILNCNLSNVIFYDNSNDVSSNTVQIEYSPEQISTNGLMSTNGFSPLILATNGNVRYFGNLES